MAINVPADGPAPSGVSPLAISTHSIVNCPEQTTAGPVYQYDIGRYDYLNGPICNLMAGTFWYHSFHIHFHAT